MCPVHANICWILGPKIWELMERHLHFSPNLVQEMLVSN